MSERIQSAVNGLQALALFLEREAGHSLISMLCIALGLMWMDPAARANSAHDIFLIGIGYLGRGMGSAKKAE